MYLDSKQKVLYAIYAEYQKDLPDLSSIRFNTIEMDAEVFRVALLKLENEKLIDETRLITKEGIEYVESKLEIDKAMSGQEKLAILKEKFGKLGWLVLKEAVNKIIINI